jgi:hypothetical protein
VILNNAKEDKLLACIGPIRSLRVEFLAEVRQAGRPPGESDKMPDFHDRAAAT